MASTISAWHFRHAPSVTRWFRSVIWMGSGNPPRVNAYECQNPFSPFVRYLGPRPWGVWQSLQTATAWWLDFVHASYCSFITWQLAHAAGSSVRYAAPRA